MLVPPTIAESQLPLPMAVHASFRPTSAEEQAVRTVILQ
jgi:hypothetical protein